MFWNKEKKKEDPRILDFIEKFTICNSCEKIIGKKNAHMLRFGGSFTIQNILLCDECKKPYDIEELHEGLYFNMDVKYFIDPKKIEVDYKGNIIDEKFIEKYLRGKKF